MATEPEKVPSILWEVPVIRVNPGRVEKDGQESPDISYEMMKASRRTRRIVKVVTLNNCP